MAKWSRANKVFTIEEHFHFRRLLDPLVAKLGGRISIEELEGFNNKPDNDVWFCRDDEDQYISSVIVTRVKDYKAGLKVLLLSHAAGLLEDFGPDSLEQVESVARHYGCARLQVDGRPGWAKALGDGWSEFSRSIEKEVNYE